MYFVWESRRREASQALVTAFAPTAKLHGVSFLLGRRFAKAIPELTIDLDAGSQGSLTDDLVIRRRRCLVHSWRLIDCLSRVGVDNIDYYPCALQNLVTGREVRTFLDQSTGAARYYYEAANILDMIYCLDTDASELEYDDEEPNELWYIHDMKLLEDRIGNVPIFRLGEDPSIVIVDERVKDAVEASGMSGPVFLPADGYRDYQGYAFENPLNVIGTHDLDPQGPADRDAG